MEQLYFDLPQISAYRKRIEIFTLQIRFVVVLLQPNKNMKIFKLATIFSLNSSNGRIHRHLCWDTKELYWKWAMGISFIAIDY